MNADRRAPVLTWTAWWLAAGAVCTSGGWLLSLIGWLGPAGYWVLVGVALVMTVIIARHTEFLRLPPWPRVCLCRYRRWWPAAFCLAAGMVVLGALAHEPNNVDAMTYRLPRVLHWLALGRWHWIDTVDPRLNYSACGQEWLMAPWLALTGSARLTWIWNFGGWLLLPGLLFLTLRDLGVRPRVAWVWMWLLPLAPLYVLQAGSVANDLLGTVYFVAALAFAARLRWGASKEALIFSMLAMALATGAKASNLPLVLPWLVLVAPIIWPNPGLRRAAWVMALPACLVSVLPTLAVNRMITGSWTGDPARITGVEAGGPWAGLVGNATQFAAQNLLPPVFPWARAAENWSGAVIEPVVRRWLHGGFPRWTIHFGELAQEEWAGIGGFMVLLLAGAWVVRRGGRRTEDSGSSRVRPAVLWAGALAGLVFFAVMGSEMTARLLAPYYPLAVAAVLVGRRSEIWIRTRTFLFLAILTVGGSVVPVVLSPARPLVPVSWLLRTAARMDGLAPGVGERARVLYGVYAERHDPLASLRVKLPHDAPVVGFMATADDSEISAWRPIGSRRVMTVRPTDSAASLRARGVSWIMVRGDAIWPGPIDRDGWLSSHTARIVDEALIRTKARQLPGDWLLVRVD